MVFDLPEKEAASLMDAYAGARIRKSVTFSIEAISELPDIIETGDRYKGQKSRGGGDFHSSRSGYQGGRDRDTESSNDNSNWRKDDAPARSEKPKYAPPPRTQETYKPTSTA